jgi:hypothetical protein
MENVSLFHDYIGRFSGNINNPAFLLSVALEFCYKNKFIHSLEHGVIADADSNN